MSEKEIEFDIESVTITFKDLINNDKLVLVKTVGMIDNEIYKIEEVLHLTIDEIGSSQNNVTIIITVADELFEQGKEKWKKILAGECIFKTVNTKIPNNIKS